MRFNKKFFVLVLAGMVICPSSLVLASGQDYYGNEDPNKKIIKQGLLGAGVGAISAGASGGDAGKGALIGAGTNVIGGALLDTLTAPSAPRQQAVQYVQTAPAYNTQPQYQTQSYPVQPQTAYRVDQQPVYVQPQPVYYQPVQQEDPNKKILKQGLLGAGVGAISASASGGKAGQGALIGAGTNVIGGALLDTLMSPSQPQPQPVYYQPVQQPQPYYPPQTYNPQQPYNPQLGVNQTQPAPKKKIIRKFDADGNVVSEEEVWI